MLSRNLLIRPISAKLLHDTEFIGKMSPYLRISAGSESLKSPVCHKGHLTPTWDTELILTLPEQINSILIELFSKETLTKDNFIGSVRFDTNQLTDQGFRGWIPLAYPKGDAGTLFLEINFMTAEIGQVKSGMPTGFVQHTPIFQREEGSTQATTPLQQSQQQPLNPIIHKEQTVYTNDEPFYVHERPIIHERTIIVDKPIFTERDIVSCEQPIIVEKPELIERHFYQQANPVIQREEAIMTKAKDSTTFEKPELYGEPIIDRETEYRHETPILQREQAEVYEQKIVTEQPIFHQKDIYHIEKPIYIERPEFIQKQIFQTSPIITETYDTVFKTEETREAVVLEGQQPKIHSDVKVLKHIPVVEFDRPEVFEKEVIHEQSIIHDQPVINVAKQIVHERPEIHERRIYHQEPLKVVKEQQIVREEQEKP